ncbi:MAG: GTPase HflX [Gammaproteobacteria bacterium]|nr:GTPase HflX [Gammaproteobacteria bacterium]
MFDRPQSGERAVLVHLDLHQESEREDLEEFRDLALSAGALPVAAVSGARRLPDAKFFVGSGKAEEIRQLVLAEEAELVLVNHGLSPAQERNLERLLQCRVLDRTGLILDIFAQRARSHEGKLQVELAQLRHLSTRLVRGWTHLERQKGGIGLRGPGETQLETDRRLLNERIKALHKRLDKVRKQRAQGRRSRQRAEVPTVSLVGYTNAGKSTLFNRLTASDAYTADQLFATLDPTLRRLEVEPGNPLILADTVGFIRHLPHDLVEAFQSTLQETREADLLLHVVDASDPEREAKIAQVDVVLRQIEADKVPQIAIYNKIDATDGVAPHVERDAEGQVLRVYLSAASGEGTELLLQVLTEWLNTERRHYHLDLPPAAGRLRARLHQMGVVVDEQMAEDGVWSIEINIAPHSFESLRKQPEFSQILPSA